MDLNETYKIVKEAFELSFTYLTNPDKRTYWLYLASSFIMAYFVYLSIKQKQFKLNSALDSHLKNETQIAPFIKYMTQKKHWLSSSAFVDYLMIVFNSLIKILFIAPFLMYSLYIGVYFNEYLIDWFGYSSWKMSQGQTIFLYTIALTIMHDFSTFFVHWLMHKIPFLWEFHKIHHSATTMNPFTQYRIHPVELIINNARGIIIIGLCTGFVDYLSQQQLEIFSIIGINVLSFLFLFLGANLRHSHIPFKYPSWLEKFIISPFQHQIHHSNHPDHFNKNLGSKLAIWDRLFGTLILSKNVKDIQFGLGEEDPSYRNFWQNLYMPFRNLVGWKR